MIPSTMATKSSITSGTRTLSATPRRTSSINKAVTGKSKASRIPLTNRRYLQDSSIVGMSGLSNWLSTPTSGARHTIAPCVNICAIPYAADPPSWGAGRRPARHVKRALTQVRTLAGRAVVCSAYLGHADPGFTLRTYTHLLPTSEDRTRRAIDKAFGEEQPADDGPEAGDGLETA